ncbi:MAG: Holliday junction resolvase RuvX [Myxococcales bacterium]|nr:Holliday junction resolvase RuvX [Myxococcales bacterium]
MKRLALDLGARFVGVAWHEEEGVPARPLPTLDLQAERSLQLAVIALVTQTGAEELIVGLPLHLDGREGLAARNARKMGASLQKRTGLPVHFVDERLTTTEAQRARIARGVKGRSGIDSEAAAIMLQTWVDMQARREHPEAL